MQRSSELEANPTPTPPLLFAHQAYWRSCAALLGQVLETAFKEDFAVELLDTPDVPGTGSRGRPRPPTCPPMRVVWEKELWEI